MTIEKCCAIILNYNSAKDVNNLTLSLIRNVPKMHIVIVDNNSPDNSYIELRESFNYYQNVSVIKTNENKGYACGNNYGIKYALSKIEPKYLLILNPDVEISKDFVTNMMHHLENDSLLAAVTGVMLSEKKHIDLSSIAWKLPTAFDDIILNIGLFKKIYNPVAYKTLNNNSSCTNVYYVDVLPGSCFMIKSDILNRVNFFDEDTFLYCEERILAKKIADIGMKNGLSIQNQYIHNHTDKNQNLKDMLKHHFLLYKSRLHYNFRYAKFGKILIPLFISSAIVGMFEKIIYYMLKNMIKYSSQK